MVNILVGGDLYPLNKNLEPFIKGDRTAILNDLDETFMKADFRIVNMECCLYDNYIPKNVFREHVMPGNVLNGFKAIGVDLACLANNHVNDIGLKGVRNTLTELDRYEISYTGVNNIFHHTFEKNGLRIAIVNVSSKETVPPASSEIQINCPENFELVEYVANLSKQFDQIVVIAHEGYQYYPLPYPLQQKMARALIRAGAKSIIYQSSHTIGAVEKYNDGVIFYGQGNIIFDNGYLNNMGMYKGYIVSLDLSKTGVHYNLIPITQSLHSTGCSRMNADEQAAFEQHQLKLAAIVNDEDKLNAEWRAHAVKTGDVLFSSLLAKQPRLKLILRKLNFTKHFIPKYSKEILLNLLECEHNNELFSEYLKTIMYE